MARTATNADAFAGTAWEGLGAALGLALSPLVALGFARFAYALLLPPMRAEFDWTFTQAGALNTANAIGYIAGALLAGAVAARRGTGRAFSGALAVSTLSLLLSAVPSDFAWFLLVRCIGGVSTAIAFVLGTSLAARAMPRQPALALSIYFAGSGLGIVLSGLLAPLLADAGGQHVRWRVGWLAMAAVAAVATVVAHRIATSPARILPPSTGARGRLGEVGQALAPSLLANLLFGAGYVGYMTYIVAYLDAQGFGVVFKALFFSLLGLASIAASPLWGQWLARCRGGRGFACVCVAVALGTVPALAWPGAACLLLSAALFGASFMAGPAAVSLAAQRSLPGVSLTLGLSLLTACFSVGQSLGPVLAGWLSDASGTLAAGLWLGPVLLVLAAATSLRQR